jgi:hypothetical protein
LSSIKLLEQEEEILKRGLKFCPTPENFNKNELQTDIDDFCRKLRLQEHFHQSTGCCDDSIARSKSSWIPDRGRNPSMDVAIDFLRNQPTRQPNEKSKYNVSLHERKAITLLQQKDNIIIKEADKGSAIVVMDKDYYQEKINDVLNDSDTYVEIPTNRDSSIHNKIKKMVNKYSNELTKNEKHYLTHFEYKTSQMYGLPKIHKSTEIIEAIQQQGAEIITLIRPSDLKFRPIIAGPACPTHRLSHFLDLLLQPYLKYIDSYVRDDLDFLNKLPISVKETEIFVTFDVVSLYSNIQKELGLTAVRYWVEHNPTQNDRLSKEFILEAIELILTNNTFQFNSQNYLQMLGTAMGTKFAPSYASLTLGYLEILFFDKMKTKFNENISLKFKKNYKRYLDDVFCLWDTDDGNILDVKNILNSLNEKMSFTLDQMGTEVNFLDIKVLRSDDQVKTDIYSKPTDSKQYLDYRSNHPRHIKNNIPFSLARRICTIVVDNKIRHMRLHELKNNLLTRNFPEGIITEGIKRACQIPLDILRSVSVKSNDQNAIPFVTTYNPNFGDLYPSVRNTMTYLKDHPNTSNTFKNTKLVKAKRQPPNLKMILTKARFESKQTHFSVTKCSDKKCKLCLNIIEGEQFMFTKNNFAFKVNYDMSCNTLNCIYVLACEGCDQIYIGETSNLRLRINLHRDHIKKNTGLGVSKHIAECTKNMEENCKFKVMPFYKVFKDDMTFRKEKESLFIKKFSPELNS